MRASSLTGAEDSPQEDESPNKLMQAKIHKNLKSQFKGSRPTYKVQAKSAVMETIAEVEVDGTEADVFQEFDKSEQVDFKVNAKPKTSRKTKGTAEGRAQAAAVEKVQRKVAEALKTKAAQRPRPGPAAAGLTEGIGEAIQTKVGLKKREAEAKREAGP